MDSCPGNCKSDVRLYRLLGKISDSLAAKSSTVFTRKTLIVSDAENLVYSRDLEHFY